MTITGHERQWMPSMYYRPLIVILGQVRQNDGPCWIVILTALGFID